MTERSVHTTEFAKALSSLKTSVTLLQNALAQQPDHIELHKALRDSCIQRFEFCVELSWKTSIKILGLELKSPHIAIRDMARNNLIDDTQIWFDFVAARNKTSHTYDEDIATQVYATAQKAITHFEDLLLKLSKV